MVELLVTILIISILAGLILGVASVAGETARAAHTRNIITRLHALLMEHYGTYKTRRVNVRPAVVNSINQNLAAGQRGQALALARLYALRELIMMEVPDRWSDILLNRVPKNPSKMDPDKYARYPFYQDSKGGSSSGLGRSSLADVYLRRYASIATSINTLSNQPNTSDEIIDNQGAECLYMIITLATAEGEARSQFHEGDIGDTDGDGAQEFLDGWGRPINFLRWAPGFDSDIQLNANELGTPTTNNTVWAAAASGDHDPFDIFRVDPPAFRLVPLIFSAGRDETFGIRLVKPHIVYLGVSNPFAAAPAPGNWPAILPYGLTNPDEDSERVYLGTDSGEQASTDNIHNHLLGRR